MTAISTPDNLVYQKPDPVKVAQITASHGADAAKARWYWVKPATLNHIAAEGRRILNARTGVIVRTMKRSITPEQEDALVATVMSGGGTTRAALQYGVSEMLVRSVLQERGITERPRVSFAERNAAGSATRNARLALAAPVEAPASGEVVPFPSPATPVSQAEPVMDVAAQNDVAPRSRSRIPKDDDVIRADHARHVGHTQSMADEYGVSYAAVYNRLRPLGLIKARTVKADDQPEVKPDWPAYAASVADIASVTSLPAPALTPSDLADIGRDLRPGIPGRPEPLQLVDRLAVADLAIAIELARTMGCEAALAVEFVRADRDASVVLQAGRR